MDKITKKSEIDRNTETSEDVRKKLEKIENNDDFSELADEDKNIDKAEESEDVFEADEKTAAESDSEEALPEVFEDEDEIRDDGKELEYSGDDGESIHSETDAEDGGAVEHDKAVSETPDGHRRKKKKLRINIPALIVRLVLLAAVVAAGVFAVKGISALISLRSINANETASVKEISVNTAGNLAYEKFQRGVLVANGGSVTYYNSKLEPVWERPGFDGSPAISVDGRYALVSYTGTPNALLITGSDAVTVTGNGNIVTGCVNENGYFALVMTEEGYKNQIAVFDNIGNVIYRWHSAENYVIRVAVSPDNRGMCAATVGVADGGIASGVMMFDFAQERPCAGQQEQDNMVMSIEYVSDRKIAVIGDKNSSYYKRDGSRISTVDYQGKNLITYDVCDNGYLALCFSKDDSAMSDSDIYTYNTNGRQKGHFESDGRVLSVSASDGKILVARDRTYDLITETCRPVKSISVVRDVKNSVLFNRGKYAFIISGNSAGVVNLK